MAVVSAFKRLKSSTPELDRVQDNIQQYTTQLDTNPLLGGVLIKDVALSTTEVKVEHKLGREPQGWLIVKKNAAQDIYESSSFLPKRYLSLTAAGTVTASIWVF